MRKLLILFFVLLVVGLTIGLIGYIIISVRFRYDVSSSNPEVKFEKGNLFYRLNYYRYAIKFRLYDPKTLYDKSLETPVSEIRKIVFELTSTVSSGGLASKDEKGSVVESISYDYNPGLHELRILLFLDSSITSADFNGLPDKFSLENRVNLNFLKGLYWLTLSDFKKTDGDLDLFAKGIEELYKYHLDKNMDFIRVIVSRIDE